jgi:hypothetical protein
MSRNGPATPAECRETSPGIYSWLGDLDGWWVEHTTTDLDLVCWTRPFTEGLLRGVELVDQRGRVHARRYIPALPGGLTEREAA